MKAVLQFAAATISIALASALAISYAAGPFESVHEFATIPFGRWTVLVVCVLATLPASATLATRFRQETPKKIGISVGLAIGILTLMANGAVGSWLTTEDSGPTVRALVRFLWCLALQTPLFLLLPLRQRIVSAREIGLAVAVAALTPTLYVEHCVRWEQVQLQEHFQRTKLRSASRSVLLLRTWGVSTIEVPGESQAGTISATAIGKVEAQLNLALKTLTEEADRPQRTTSWAAVQRRVQVLGQLERHREAEDLLLPWVDREPDAELMLAMVNQHQERYPASDELYRSAALRAEQAGFDDPAGLQRQRWVRALRGLAFNARQRQDFPEGARLYSRLIEAVPQMEAELQWELGQHWEAAQRPRESIRAYQRAANLKPAVFEEIARERIRTINREAPTCFLGSN